MAVASCYLGSAAANPTDGTVVSGSATISSSGNTLTITNTPGAIINWKQFSIQPNEVTRFIQQNASSAVLNRVTTQNPSTILGTLTSNGRVFLINPSGIAFGQGSVINVAGLAASTLDISNSDFLSGRMRFVGTGSEGSVSNAGTITTPEGGHVYLIAPNVRNEATGVITSPKGEVVIAAGQTVELVNSMTPDLRVEFTAPNNEAVNAGQVVAASGRIGVYGTLIRNSGLVSATRAEVGDGGKIVFRAVKDVTLDAGSRVEANGNQGGTVTVQADTGTLLAQGTVEAKGDTQQGGQVQLLGNQVALDGATSVDASGNTGGGRILIGGDTRGANPDVQNANAVYVGANATVRADAGSSGDGGSVVIYSKDSTKVYGNVSAQGSATGKGGSVETSGRYLEVAQGPNVSGGAGGGSWLIDPYDIEIVAGNGTNNNSGAPTFTPNGDSSKIGADLISGQLNGGASVTVDTAGAGTTEPGNLTVSAGINSGTNASLALHANNDVAINAQVIMSNGNLDITAGRNVAVTQTVISAGSNVTAGGTLSVVGSGGTTAALSGLGGGQTINAGGVEVRSQGGLALISNQGSGNQTINVNGGSLDVVANSNNASISNSAPGAIQTITVTNGDHINVLANGAGTSASIGVSNGNQTVTVTNGDHITVLGAGTGSAATIGGSPTTQSVSVTGSGANAVTVGTTTLAAPGALGTSQISATSNQAVTAGVPGQSGSITIIGSDTNNSSSTIATNASPTGTQSISTSGALSVTGGRAPNQATNRQSGVFHQGGGDQTITAGSITVQGGPSGNNNGAFVTNNNNTANNSPNVLTSGKQAVTVTGGSIAVTGGTVGVGNLALLRTVNGDQTIDGNPVITVTGGASGGVTGNPNFAAIQSGSANAATGGPIRKQTINAGSITLTSGASGTDNSSSMTGAVQEIHAAGSVQVSGSGASGTSSGSRIGGIAGVATNLTLTAGGNVVLTGGSGTLAGARFGAPISGTPVASNVTVVATGDVILNEGPSIGSAIGYSTLSVPGGGTIKVTGNSIQMNGAAQTTGIRTTGSVELHADNTGGTITQGSQGFVTASSLTTTSDGATNLGGPNQVSTYNGKSTNAGIALNNNIPLTVTGLTAAGNTTITNAGAMVINGAINTGPGALAITTSGPGSNLTILNNVFSGGAMNLSVGGGLSVSAGGTQSAVVSNGTGEQRINAQSLNVSAQDSQSAIISGSGAIQQIDITGGNLDVTAQTGGTAQIAAAPGTIQNIRVMGGDHLNVNGVGGSASIAAAGSQQMVSITGAGANVMNVGSATATGSSQIVGQSQQIKAGAGILESGTINIVGGATGSNASIVTSNGTSADTQDVFSAVALNITGGTAASGVASGIFHNRQGQQSVTANSFSLQGGSSGSGNGAFISSNSSGAQSISGVGGNITIAGGSGGTNNRAGITSNSSQGIFLFDPGSITLTGGAGSGNSVSISAVGSQGITARDINLTSGSGADSSAVIGASSQNISAGSVTIAAGTGGGTLNGARIGGLGGASPTATSLILNAGDVILNGGSTVGNGAALGSSGAAPTQPNDINVHANNVILNAGPGGAARIGTTFNSATPAAGTISVTANNAIQLNGTAGRTGIRTTGTVTLNAGTISEATNGSIEAGALATTSVGDTTLAGPNRVGTFNGTTTGGGNLTFNNAGTLNVTGLSVGGNTTLSNTGVVTVSGVAQTSGSLSVTTTGPGSDLNVTNNVASGGSMYLGVTGAVNVTSGGAQSASLQAGGEQTISAQALNVTSRDGQFAAVSTSSANQYIGITGGGVNVEASPGGGSASISSGNAQQITVSGTGVNVDANGGFASIAASNGQNLQVNGGAGVDVSTSGGGNAQIQNISGGQSIVATDADHIRLNGAGGTAAISSFSAQTVSITGSGANAITVGSAGATGPSTIQASGNQSIRAGNAGEAGSISIVGSSGSGPIGTTGIITFSGSSSQNVSTSGALSITGGAAASAFNAGISHSGSDVQSISAASVSLTGGAAGSGNGASISSNSGSQHVSTDSLLLRGGSGSANNGAFLTTNTGSQLIEVTGALSATGGTAGSGNRAGISTNSGTQTVTASSVSLIGGTVGTNNNVFISTNAAGATQSVGADSISVAGGASGNGNAAFITTAGIGATQTVTASSISATGGTVGNGNRAGITTSNADQFIYGNAAITVTGGASGGVQNNSNTATVGANGTGRTQTVNASSITVTGGAGGIENSATMTGNTQVFTVAGDVRVTGGNSGGTLTGARIGGGGTNAPTSTNLTITAGGDVVLTGGTQANAGARLGTTVVSSPVDSNVTVNANNVILNEGTAVGAAIGYSTLSTAPGGGAINVNAANSIQMNGSVNQAAIRTTGNVNLNAPTITQGSNGRILASSLSASSMVPFGGIDLGGQNQVSSFSGSTMGGDLRFNNTGALTVTGFSSPGAATLTNAGSVNVAAGFINGGTLSLTAAGTGSDLTLPGFVSSNGAMTLNAGRNVAINGATLSPPTPGLPSTATSVNSGGAMTINAGGNVAIAGDASSGGTPTTFGVSSAGPMTINAGGTMSVTASGAQNVFVSSNGGQTINAGSLSVTAQDGRLALLSNNGAGNQTIAVTGGAGIDVTATGAGSNAQIGNSAVGGTQTIAATNSDHINVRGNGGVAGIFGIDINNNAGTQVVSITGSGANAINVTASGAGSGAAVVGIDQTVKAGLAGQSGSINLGGPASISTNGPTGAGAGTQTVSATGTITLDGGSASIQHQRVGPQTITADSIVLQGATSGSNAGARIGSSAAGAKQAISANTISLAGGTGTGNGATIFANGQQTVSAGTITVQGGTAGSGNTAGISTGAGATQSISAGSISVTGGAGGTNNNVFLSGNGGQTINTGSLSIQGGLGGNGNVASVNTIVSGATQTINAGSISLKGGGGGNGNRATLATTDANQVINGNPTITVSGGDSGGIVGTPNLANISAGGVGRTQEIHAASIDVKAGAGGTDNSASITGDTQNISVLGDVKVSGNTSTGNASGARIGGIGGTTPGATRLTLNVGGDVILQGGDALNAGGGLGGAGSASAAATNTITVNAGGNVILNEGAGAGARIGYSTLSAPSGGDISVTAGGEIQLNGTTHQVGVRTLGDVTLTAAKITGSPTGVVIANNLTTQSTGTTNLPGANQVASFNGSSSGGDVSLNNLGALSLAGLSAAGAGSLSADSLNGAGNVTTGTGFTVAVANDSLLSGVIGGAGGLNKNGAGTLTVSGNNTYAGDTNVNAGTLALGGSDQTNNGVVNISSGATYRGSAGSFTNAGVIGGNGTLDVAATSFTNNGTLRPGGNGAIGTLTVAGNATLGSTSVVEIEAQSASSHDVLAVTGTAALGGNLNVTPINGYSPANGDTLTPVTYASRSGTVYVPGTWLPTYNPANLQLGFDNTINRWTGTTGNWNVDANWSRGHTPLASETVLIDVPGTQLVTLSDGTRFGGKLVSFENFSMSGGSLTLGGASSFNGALSLSGGTLQGTGGISANSLFTWTGGKLAGTGQFVTAPGSIVTLAPSASSLQLARNWQNQGFVTWQGANGKDLVIAEGASLVNALGGVVTLAAAEGSNIRGKGSFANDGTLNMNGAGLTAINSGFANGPTGVLNVNSGTLKLKSSDSNEGTIGLASGATLQVKGGYVNNGTVWGNGTIDPDGQGFTNLGVVAPGAANGAGIGTLTIKGDYYQGVTGVLNMGLGGTAAGQYDTLAVTGKVYLGGTLLTSAVNGYAPTAGDSFKLLTYKSRSGQFATLQAPASLQLGADYEKRFGIFTLE